MREKRFIYNVKRERLEDIEPEGIRIKKTEVATESNANVHPVIRQALSCLRV
jgi:hypothetical protein